MTLATCAKDLKFYNWPSVTLSGVYETPDTCMSIKSLSWCNNGEEICVVQSHNCPVIVKPTNGAEKTIEAKVCLNNMSDCTVGTFANTSTTSIAFGGINGEVFIYDVKKKRRLVEYQLLPATVNFLEFSCEDTCLVAGSTNSNTISLYNANIQPIATYEVPHSYSLSALAFNSTMSNILAAASKEGVMAVWNTELGAMLMTGKNHSAAITDMTFSGDIVTTVGADSKFITYDVRSADYTACYNLNTPLAGLAYLQDSYDLAISTCDGQLRSYDKRCMNTPLNTVIAYNCSVKKICFPPNCSSSSIPDTRNDSYVFKPDKVVSTRHPPASGDFNDCCSESSSTVLSVDEQKQSKKYTDNVFLHEVLPPSASQVGISDPQQPNEPSSSTPAQPVTIEEMHKFAKEMEDHFKRNKAQLEEKMLNTFYSLRIELSKQFIELHHTVNRSWDAFVEYYRRTEAKSVQSTSSMDAYTHAMSEVKSKLSEDR